MSDEKGIVVKTPEFRVSYPNVFTARMNDLSGKEEYSLVALFPKGADMTELQNAAKAAIKAKWGDKAPKGLRSPFRKHEEKANEDGSLPIGYEEGGIFINVKSKMRPGVVGTNIDEMTGKLEVLDETSFYPGCYARMTVNAYAYDQKGNRGVSFGLRNVQKLRDGDPLGGRSRPEDDFEPVETADGATPQTADDLWGSE